MSQPLQIVVGITGGIAAYKAVSVIRGFVTAGHNVQVVATQSALEFVGVPTLEAISRNPVHTSLYDDVASVRHVALGQQADVIVVAPATANSIAQFAAGLAPDLLGNTVLARRCPLVIVPAMHTEMWHNPATQANIETLKSRGVIVIGPVSGQLTGTDVGMGKMSEPEEIVAATLELITPGIRDLLGTKILITAGGTREPIDPVRFIGNRSSGKQALAFARNAVKRGAEVTVISAHTEVSFPESVTVIPVSTTQQMFDAAIDFAPENDVIIMAAAVADYRVEHVSDHKLKKDSSAAPTTLSLIENVDILATLCSSKKHNQVVIGFAAETEANASQRLLLARSKIEKKQCDFLVLNRVDWDQGFGTNRNDVQVLSLGNDKVVSIEGTKDAIASGVLDLITH